MSRLALAVLVLAAVAGPLCAQSDPDPEGAALLRRAEQLTRDQSRNDSLRRAQSAEVRHGHVVRSGALVMVFHESVTPELGQRVLARADSLLEAFGGDVAAWRDSIVGVQVAISDSARLLSASDLARRTPILVDMDFGGSDAPWGGNLIARVVGVAYRERLDRAWRDWLPREFGFEWSPQYEGERALGALTEPQNSTGAGCLAGRVAECRLWLGLDPTDRPIAVRYRVTDMRDQMGRSPYFHSQAPERQACIDGVDAACVRFAEQYQLMYRIPSPDIARASMVRAVWALHGPAAISRMFRDTVGGAGERLARATGISEDSLVVEWRAWTLARGRPDRLMATLPQSLAVIFAALLVVFLAARSGRWR